MSAFRARAESEAGSSPFPRGKAPWEHLPRRSTTKETASRDNWLQSFLRSSSEWTYSPRNRRPRQNPKESMKALATLLLNIFRGYERKHLQLVAAGLAY